MNISLTPELESIVQEKVKSGMYHSASEVVREALRLLQEQDQMRQIRLRSLRQDIAVGVAQADSGDLTPLDMNEIKAEGRRRRKGKPWGKSSRRPKQEKTC